MGGVGAGAGAGSASSRAGGTGGMPVGGAAEGGKGAVEGGAAASPAGIGHCFVAISAGARPEGSYTVSYGCQRRRPPPLAGVEYCSGDDATAPPATQSSSAQQGPGAGSVAEVSPPAHSSSSQRLGLDAGFAESSEHAALLSARAAQRASGKCERRGPLGVGCNFALTVEAATGATRALCFVSLCHTGHDPQTAESCRHLPLPPALIYGGGGGITGDSELRGGASHADIMKYLTVLSLSAAARASNLLLGRSAHAPTLRGGTAALACSPSRITGPRPVYGAQVAFAAEAADTSYSAALAASAAAGAAALAVCGLCLATLDAASVRCTCARHRSEGAHADCLVARYPQAAAPAFVAGSCALCEAMGGDEESYAESIAAGAGGAEVTASAEAGVAGACATLAPVIARADGDAGPAQGGGGVETLSLRQILARLDIAYCYSGERYTLRLRELHNLNASMRRAGRGGATVGADLLAAMERYRGSSDFITHLWYRKDATGTTVTHLHFLAISRHLLHVISGHPVLLAFKYSDLTFQIFPFADVQCGWINLICCEAGGLALPGPFMVHMRPPKEDRGADAGAAQHDLAVFLAKAASFIEHGIGLCKPTEAAPLLRPMAAAARAAVRSPFSFLQSDKCPSQALANLYVAQRALGAALPALAELTERMLALAESATDADLRSASALVSTLPAYVCGAGALPLLPPAGAEAALGGWWGEGWEVSGSPVSLLAGGSVAPASRWQRVRFDAPRQRAILATLLRAASESSSSTPAAGTAGGSSSMPAAGPTAPLLLPQVLPRTPLFSLLLPHHRQMPLSPEELCASVPTSLRSRDLTSEEAALFDAELAPELRGYGSGNARGVALAGAEALLAVVPRLLGVDDPGAWDMELAPLAWLLDLSRGEARSLLSSASPFFELCEWHDMENVSGSHGCDRGRVLAARARRKRVFTCVVGCGEGNSAARQGSCGYRLGVTYLPLPCPSQIKKNLAAKVRDFTLHEQLKRLYKTVISGAITPTLHDTLAPTGTPTEWLRYLRDNQFSPAMLPRLFHPLRELFDAPPGYTNDLAEHMHKDFKMTKIPSAPGDILASVLGSPGGPPSGFVSGKWRRRADILSGRDDLPQYSARIDLLQSFALMASQHSASHKASDPLRPGRFVRDGEGRLFTKLGWNTPGFAARITRGIVSKATPFSFARVASTGVLRSAAAIVLHAGTAGTVSWSGASPAPASAPAPAPASAPAFAPSLEPAPVPALVPAPEPAHASAPASAPSREHALDPAPEPAPEPAPSVAVSAAALAPACGSAAAFASSSAAASASKPMLLLPQPVEALSRDVIRSIFPRVADVSVNDGREPARISMAVAAARAAADEKLLLDSDVGKWSNGVAEVAGLVTQAAAFAPEFAVLTGYSSRCLPAAPPLPNARGLSGVRAGGAGARACSGSAGLAQWQWRPSRPRAYRAVTRAQRTHGEGLWRPRRATLFAVLRMAGGAARSGGFVGGRARVAWRPPLAPDERRHAPRFRGGPFVRAR